MSSTMPEFEMPPERPAAPARPGRDEAAALAAGREEARAAEAPDGDAEAPRGRRRLVVGVVVAAALVLGGVASALVQQSVRAAAEADTAAIATLAERYLLALQDGRAEEATALVPVSGDATLLTDAVLAAASRISHTTIGEVAIDGPSATVEVGYRTGAGAATRALAAERDGDGWRIATSLAEPIELDPSQMLGHRPTIAGVAVGADGPTLLYPAGYRTDRIERAMWVVEPATLLVDGDPRTPSGPLQLELGVTGSPLPVAHERAQAHLAACITASTCAEAAGALTSVGTTSVLELGSDGGLTARVEITALPSGAGGLRELVIDVRAAVGEDGEVSWACAGPTRTAAVGVPTAACEGAP